MAERKLTVVLAGDSKGLQRAMGDADKATSGLGSKLASFGKTAAIGIGALGVGAVVLGKGFVDAAVESQKITAQTDAVIKSMGNSANVTSKQVGDLAGSLAMKTGVDDEVIQSGQNVLLTFGNITNAIGDGPKTFDRATKAALDMSVALGTDMSSASMMVGKALNDPIDGLSKLARSGIQFTDQQKEQIKTMQESGDMAGAQAIMLKELERQFGGSAAAQATAGDRLKVVWGNLQEEIGKRLLPVVEKVAGFFADNLPAAFDKAGRIIGPVAKTIGMFFNTLKTGFTEDEGTPVERFALKVREVFGQVADIAKQWGPVVLDALRQVAAFVTGTVVPALVGLGAWVIENKPVLIGLGVAIAVGLVSAFVSWAVAAGTAAVATIAATAPVIAIGVAIAALVAGIIWAYQNWDFFRNAVDRVASFMRNTLWPALQSVAQWIINTMVPTIGRIAASFGEWIGRGMEVVGWFRGLPGSIGAAMSGLADTITRPFRSAFDSIRRLWNNTIGGFGFSVGGWDPPGPGPTVPGFSFRIPQMAQGGIVKSRPGGILANIGEGRFDEAVVPLDGKHGFGDSGPKTINLMLPDGRTLFSWVLDAADEYGTSNGRAVLGVG